MTASWILLPLNWHTFVSMPLFTLHFRLEKPSRFLMLYQVVDRVGLTSGLDRLTSISITRYLLQQYVPYRNFSIPAYRPRDGGAVHFENLYQKFDQWLLPTQKSLYWFSETWMGLRGQVGHRRTTFLNAHDFPMVSRASSGHQHPVRWHHHYLRPYHD